MCSSNEHKMIVAQRNQSHLSHSMFWNVLDFFQCSSLYSMKTSFESFIECKLYI